MKDETISIQNRIEAACKQSYNFESMVKLCETQIELFVAQINAANDKPTTILRSPSSPEHTLVSILLPVIPMSPNETQLLLEYLNDKYIGGKEGPVVGGDYFSIRKCFFKNNYKLTTNNNHYYDI